MPHPFVHVELYTGDIAKAKEFYSRLFGWKLEDVPMPGGKTYTLIKVGEGTGGGMLTSPTADTPPHWLAYVGVEDIVASTKQAQALGAKVKHDIMDIEGAGKMSIIVDPTGATIALWEPRRDS